MLTDAGAGDWSVQGLRGSCGGGADRKSVFRPTSHIHLQDKITARDMRDLCDFAVVLNPKPKTLSPK